MINRLAQFIDYLDISVRAFEMRISASDGMIRRAIVNKTDIQAKWIVNIADNYPELNIDWLITGKGKMLRTNNIVIETKDIVKTDGYPGIPLVSLSAAAGFGNSHFTISESDVKEYYVIPKFKTLKPEFLIEVYGPSMENEYCSGDVVACKILRESKFIQWNKCHVIATTEQGLLIKRIKKGSSENTILAVSDNKDYDPFLIPLNEITGIALVVGVIRLK